ncbi:MAG: site-specific integrase [Lachnospiraceae bacterium]|nr:site-specific integrase [Lachnospiraceae bacterium]
MIIKIQDLDCYKNATDEQRNHKLVSPERGFDLSKLDNEMLRLEMGEFIRYRGSVLSLSSIRTELGNYNQFCRAMKEAFPQITSIKAVSYEELQKGCRKWLMKKGYRYSRMRKRVDSERESRAVAPLIAYIRVIYEYFHMEEDVGGFDCDIWVIDQLGITIDLNPVHRVKSISFKRIEQLGIRGEIKQVMRLHLREKALGTVCAEMTAVGRFAEWLAENHPEMDTLVELNRFIIEEYLLHTNLEATGRKDYSKDLSHLKSVLRTASMILEAPILDNLFLNSDSGRKPETIYKSYSDEEIRRLNNAIVAGIEEQMARAILVHQLLGTRISEALTIKRSSIGKSNRGTDMVTIYQVKTHKSYSKIMGPDVKALLMRSMDYTKERFGDCEYIFVNDRNPEEPMQYSRIQYALNKIIIKNDLRDDQGERFTVGTHIMRHTYARKLTELHIDDMTIAKLLGQSGTDSLKYYRKMSPQRLYEETKDVLNQVDAEISDIMEEWNGKGREDI